MGAFFVVLKGSARKAQKNKMNEILLLLSVAVFFYGIVLLAYRLFGKSGLFGATVICTILANIEVLILVDAFGMEQTLGNVLFAATYLVTDILSENESKKDASRAVGIGVFATATMLVITQSWLLFTPSANDWAMSSIRTLFSATPRIAVASFIGYVVSQNFDVWLYHKWWDFSSKKFGDSQKMLWLRNNGSTLISQLVNTIIFTTIGFAGFYNTKTLFSIMLSSYIIYVATSLLDTPAVYLARRFKQKNKIPE